MLTMSAHLVAALLLLLGASNLIAGFQIQVINKTNNTVLETYTDTYASYESRSYRIKGTIEGLLVYVTPRNACSTVEMAPESPNGTLLFAFIPDYSDCPGDNAINVEEAEYQLMVAETDKNWKKDKLLSQTNSYYLPQALVDKKFGSYLRNIAVVSNYTSEESYDIYIIISNQSIDFRSVVMLFALVVFCAIAVSVAVFCSVTICRWAINKWKRRGLTQWRVSQLPKRKFRLSREGTQTCSICLEEYKDKEQVRVLPCNHMFHPKCVDEWLKKWNRTCPLCKSSISRKKKKREDTQPLLETDTATTPDHSSPGSGGRGSYGTMDDHDQSEDEPAVVIATVHGPGATPYPAPMAVAV